MTKSNQLHRFSETNTECKLADDILNSIDFKASCWQLEVCSVLVVNKATNPVDRMSNYVMEVFDLKSNINTSFQQIDGATSLGDQTLCSFPVDLKYIGNHPTTKILFPWNNFKNVKFVFCVNELAKNAEDPKDWYLLDVEIQLLLHKLWFCKHGLFLPKASI